MFQVNVGAAIFTTALETLDGHANHAGGTAMNASLRQSSLEASCGGFSNTLLESCMLLS